MRNELICWDSSVVVGFVAMKARTDFKLFRPLLKVSKTGVTSWRFPPYCM